MGLRLRLNFSNDEDFDEAVKSYRKSLAISWYKHQTAKSELMKNKIIDRIEYLKNENERKKKTKKISGSPHLIQGFPHPRQVLSKNYHVLE